MGTHIPEFMVCVYIQPIYNVCTSYGPPGCPHTMHKCSWPCPFCLRTILVIESVDRRGKANLPKNWGKYLTAVLSQNVFI